MKPKARGRKIYDEAAVLEEKVYTYVQQLRKKSRRVSTLIVLRKALEIYPNFLKKKNKSTAHQYKALKKWFYYGFKKKVCHEMEEGQ